MKKNKRPWIFLLEYGIFRFFSTTLRLVPSKGLPRVGALLGMLFYVLLASRRRLTVSNLKASFPAEGDRSAATARRVFRTLGIHLVEFLNMASYPPTRIRGGFQIRGVDHFETARRHNRGVILLGSHFGNWELMNLCIASSGYPLHVVARPLDNPWLNRWVNRARERFGTQVIDSKHAGALRSILHTLRKGGTVGFLIDQNVRGDRGVFVDFFGRLAYTHKVVAMLALKTGCPVVPVFIRRRADGLYLMDYRKALNLERTGHLGRDLITNTQVMTRVLEAEIRSHPAGWFWMHDRWKKRPENSQPAVFLDRDGTITKEIGYVHDIDRLELIPGSARAIGRLNEAGIKVIVVTNQSGVARGYFGEDHVHRVNKRLVELLEKDGASVDAVYYCPHHPVEGSGAYTRDCECRKPSPGMLVWAANEEGVALEGSYVVGDKRSDVTLARRIHASAVLVQTGYGKEESERIATEASRPHAVAADLQHAVTWILDHERSGRP